LFINFGKKNFHLIFLFQQNSSAQQQLKEIRKRPIRPAGRRVKATKPLEEMVSPDTPLSAIKQVIRKFSPNIDGELYLLKHTVLAVGQFGALSVIRIRFPIHSELRKRYFF
jgi:hypothetical protein